jgi:hypothetical protein
MDPPSTTDADVAVNLLWSTALESVVLAAAAAVARVRPDRWPMMVKTATTMTAATAPTTSNRRRDAPSATSAPRSALRAPSRRLVVGVSGCRGSRCDAEEGARPDE